MRIECPLEPAFLALGPYHLAVGMNNRVWICELANQGTVREMITSLYCIVHALMVYPLVTRTLPIGTKPI